MDIGFWIVRLGICDCVFWILDFGFWGLGFCDDCRIRYNFPTPRDGRVVRGSSDYALSYASKYNILLVLLLFGHSVQNDLNESRSDEGWGVREGGAVGGGGGVEWWRRH